jgi:hypothetical protein
MGGEQPAGERLSMPWSWGDHRQKVAEDEAPELGDRLDGQHEQPSLILEARPEIWTND